MANISDSDSPKKTIRIIYQSQFTEISQDLFTEVYCDQLADRKRNLSIYLNILRSLSERFYQPLNLQVSFYFEESIFPDP